MNLLSKLFRSRDKPQNHLGGLSFLFGQTAAGKAVNEVPLRFGAPIHRPHLGALLRCEGELAAVEGEEPLCTEAVNAAVDCL